MFLTGCLARVSRHVWRIKEFCRINIISCLQMKGEHKFDPKTK